MQFSENQPANQHIGDETQDLENPLLQDLKGAWFLPNPDYSYEFRKIIPGTDDAPEPQYIFDFMYFPYVELIKAYTGRKSQPGQLYAQLTDRSKMLAKGLTYQQFSKAVKPMHYCYEEAINKYFPKGWDISPKARNHFSSRVVTVFPLIAEGYRIHLNAEFAKPPNERSSSLFNRSQPTKPLYTDAAVRTKMCTFIYIYNIYIFSF